MAFTVNIPLKTPVKTVKSKSITVASVKTGAWVIEESAKQIIQ